MRMINRSLHFGLPIGMLALLMGQGCPAPVPLPPPPDGSGTPPLYNNTTDRTNDGATYLGSAACRACHPNIADQHSIHGHAFKLTRVQGEPPVFPPEATRAAVPETPEGYTWNDIAYVIGGYIRKARYIDNEGYILTTGFNQVDTQLNIAFPANGTTPSFVAYDPEELHRKPYDYSCFVCHTTGPQPRNEDFPEFQENRPGFIGTWQEAGIQCEACHGPGSKHVPNPAARTLFVDNSAKFCGECHNRPFNSDGSVIVAKGGYIQHHEQYPELLASGGHANLDCTICHNPHASTNYDRANAIRNECRDCHTDQGMALHRDKVFVRGDYVEQLDCQSCHMPYATKSAASASSAIIGDLGRMGDTKTHIFRIDANPVDYKTFFTDDLKAVRKGEDGKAAVTVDFVCLRCHNGIGNAFNLTVPSAGAIADGIHQAGQ